MIFLKDYLERKMKNCLMEFFRKSGGILRYSGAMKAGFHVDALKGPDMAMKTALNESKVKPLEILKYAKICRADKIVKPLLEAII